MRPTIHRDRYTRDAFVYAERLWIYAREMAEQAENAYRPAPLFISSVLFAAASLEAFMNELPWLAAQSWEDEKAVTLCEVLSDAEGGDGRAPTSIRTKLAMAVLALGGRLRKGEQPYQDFELLFKLRDAIMHPKAHLVTHTAHGTQVEPVKLLSSLLARGLIEYAADGPKKSFLSLVATVGVSSWAIDTAKRTMAYILGHLEGTFFGNTVKFYLMDVFGFDYVSLEAEIKAISERLRLTMGLDQPHKPEQPDNNPQEQSVAPEPGPEVVQTYNPLDAFEELPAPARRRGARTVGDDDNK